jgi:hypothetical protein
VLAWRTGSGLHRRDAEILLPGSRPPPERQLDWLDRPSNKSMLEGAAFFRRQGWNYWVLVGADRTLVASLGLRPLWSEPEAGVVLAAPPRAP